MIVCRNCFKEMDDGAVFCDFCGHELAAPDGRSRERRTSAPARSYNGTPPLGPVALPPSLLGGRDGAALGPSVPTTYKAEPASAGDVEHLIIILVEPNTNAQFTLRGKHDYVVGRTTPGTRRVTDVPLDVDLEQYNGLEAGVSRRHLVIHVRSDGVFVEDLESTNETAQNGFRLMPLQRYPLHHGDDLRLGGLQLKVVFQRV